MNWRPALARMLGLGTTAYGLAIIARPELLARPCGLADDHGEVPSGLRTTIAAIGARDAAIGAAMVLATPGRGLRAAVLARIASDTADAVIFGTGLPDPAARRKVAAVALSFAALCGLTLPGT